MAQIGSVNAVFTASVGGLTAGVAAASKAFKTLGGDTAALRSSLNALEALGKQDVLSVGPAASTASAAFKELSGATVRLREQLAAGAITAGDFAMSMTEVTTQAQQMARATADAAAITRENITIGQQYLAALDRIANAVRNGGLAEDVASRAREAALQTYLRQADAARGAGDGVDAMTAKIIALKAELETSDMGAAALSEFATAAEVIVADFTAAAEDIAGALELQTGRSIAAKVAEEQRQEMMARAAEIARSVASATKIHADAIDELDVLYASGVLPIEAYNAAVERQNQILAEADGSAAAARAAESALAATRARGAQITRDTMTAAELYKAEIDDLNSLLRAGAISEQTFDRATAAAAARMREAGTSAKAMDSGLGGITSRLNVLIGLNVAQLFSSLASSISNAVGNVIRMGQAEATVIDQTSKLAARIGLTYGEMAGLGLAASKAGVSLETVGDAVTKSDVAFVRAAQGSQQAIDAFESLGLSVQQLNGLAGADRFEAIATAIAALPTEAERAAAATQVFGRAGADLLPLFNQGAAGIAAARTEAERLGLALTTTQGQDVQGLVSAFEAAQKAVQGIVQQVVAYLSPAITGVINQFNAFVANIGGANIGQAIGDGILTGAEYLAGVADWIIANFKGVFEFFSTVGQQWGAVMSFADRVAAVFQVAFNAFEIAGNVVGGILSNAIAGLFRAAANLADLLPGFSGWADGFNATADSWAGAVTQYNTSIRQNADEAAAAWNRAFGPQQANQVGQAIAGPVTSILRSARETAQRSAAAIEQAKAAPVPPVQVKQQIDTSGISQALKAVDARSTEGLAEMFRIMRGDTGNVQEQQLDALHQIAENTAGLEPMPAFALPGA